MLMQCPPTIVLFQKNAKSLHPKAHVKTPPKKLATTNAPVMYESRRMGSMNSRIYSGKTASFGNMTEAMYINSSALEHFGLPYKSLGIKILDVVYGTAQPY